MNFLLEYINVNGILLCNTNPYLPALEDIGCTWHDVEELIDSHRLFYSKVFKGRTTYLSVETYYLLKTVRTQKELTKAAEKIYSLLDGNPPADTTFLKQASGLPVKEYREGFDFLLRNLYITAIENGKKLNESWSAFYYGTAADWEKYTPGPALRSNAPERLRELLSGTMTEKQIQSLMRS